MPRFATLFAIALTGGCNDPAVAPDDTGVDINAAALAAQRSIDEYAANHVRPAPRPGKRAPLPLDPPAPGTPGGLPDDRTPLSEAPFTADSAQGAATVVQTYYALLGERRYTRAWALWADGGKASGQSAKAFAQSFGRYSAYHANVGAPGPIDAGAGQRHVTVPVQVYGRLGAGARPFHTLGTVTLHRVGDVDGATPAQRTWHIRSIDLAPPTGAGAKRSR